MTRRAIVLRVLLLVAILAAPRGRSEARRQEVKTTPEDTATKSKAYKASTVIEYLETKQHVWDLCLGSPPPMGFDPAPIYGAIEDPATDAPITASVASRPTASSSPGGQRRP